MTTLLDDLAEICDRVSAAKKDFAGELTELRRTQTTVHEVLQAVDDSWSQSNVGYHADLYFGDFERPSLGQRFDPEWGGINGIPEGWSDRTIDDVQQVVATRASIGVGQFVDTVNARVDEVRQLVTDVCVSLAPIRLTQGLEREAEMLDVLESSTSLPARRSASPAPCRGIALRLPRECGSRRTRPFDSAFAWRRGPSPLRTLRSKTRTGSRDAPLPNFGQGSRRRTTRSPAAPRRRRWWLRSCAVSTTRHVPFAVGNAGERTSRSTTSMTFRILSTRFCGCISTMSVLRSGHPRTWARRPGSTSSSSGPRRRDQDGARGLDSPQAG